MLRIDALPYSFDQRTGRYRWTEGASKGKLAPREAILSLTNRYVETEGQKLAELGKKLGTNAITTKDFERQAGEILRSIHAGSAILGKGGIDKMTNADWSKVQDLLKVQLYKGRDGDRRFGIKHLVQEFRDGTCSPAQLSARLQMYAQSGKLTYHAMELQAQKERGITTGKRVLGAVHQHCAECLDYAGRGAVPLSELVLPGQACSCRSNCKCSVVYE